MLVDGLREAATRRPSLLCTSATRCRTGTAERARRTAIATCASASCCSNVSPCHGGNASCALALFSATMRMMERAHVLCCRLSVDVSARMAAAHLCHTAHAARRS